MIENKEVPEMEMRKNRARLGGVPTVRNEEGARSLAPASKPRISATYMRARLERKTIRKQLC
ncbi:MAG: hypothetical protein NVS9B14_17940 [Candidatus Acidiferrum sp.]